MTTATVTINDFLSLTRLAVQTQQPRYQRAAAEALVALIRTGDFTAEYLNAVATGIRYGVPGA